MATLKVPVTSEDHVLGPSIAPVTLVEYGDYECPYCGKAEPVVKKLLHTFGDRLRFVFRNFPLVEAHPFAEPASEAAEFAARFDRFWQMHDLLYQNQDMFSLPFFLELGDTLKLPREGLELAIVSKTYGDKVQNDFMGGVRSGVNGTPTFFINGVRYNGPFDFESLKSAIEMAAK